MKREAERKCSRFRQANTVVYEAALKANQPCHGQSMNSARYPQNTSAGQQACANFFKVPASPVVSAVNDASRSQDPSLLRNVVSKIRTMRQPNGPALDSSQQDDCYRKEAAPKRHRCWRRTLVRPPIRWEGFAGHHFGST